MKETNKGAQQVLQLQCPACHTLYKAPVWVVVMPGSKALKALQKGELNESTCPKCGHNGILPVPFILYQPERQRATCFIPLLQETGPEQQDELVKTLLLNLRQQLGPVRLQDSGIKDVSVVDDFAEMVLLSQGADLEG